MPPPPSANEASSSSDDDDNLPPPPSDSILHLLRSALSRADQRIAMLSNYSASYNAVNVGIALPVLKYSMNTDGAADQQDPSDEHHDDSLVASSLLAGMIVGQLLGGYLGDVVGRRRAVTAVVLLQILGSLGGAFLSTDYHEGSDSGGTPSYYWSIDDPLDRLAVWRFILGVGAGGVYPLAAVMSAENKQTSSDDGSRQRQQQQRVRREEQLQSNDETHADHNAESEAASFRRVALTFSMQGLGFVTVPLVSYPMLAVRIDTDVVWRLLLGLGALPGFIVLYLRWMQQRNEKMQTSDNDDDDDVAPAAEGGSLELTQPATEEEDGNNISSDEHAETMFQSTVSTLFNDIVEGDPRSHVNEDHQISLIADNDENNDEKYEGFNDPPGGFVLEHEPQLSSPVKRETGLWASLRDEPNLARKLAGTAGTWFLFDLIFYGNTLFEPVVLEAAFGSNDDEVVQDDGYTLLLMAVRDSLLISLLSLPGYFFTVMLIGRRTCVCRSVRTRSSARCNTFFSPVEQTPAYIQMQGFCIMFILYLIIGLWWTSLSDIQWLLLVLYASSFFFANYGPNSTTFLLPSVTYSKDCRSTLNGISAAAGKLGALVGASAFEPAADAWGESTVMIVCAVISLFGCGLTKLCVGQRKEGCYGTLRS